MNIYDIAMGAAISANCLLAWSSRSHGAKCLSMWAGMSFVLGLVVLDIIPALCRLFLARWPEVLAAIEPATGFPWSNAFLSMVDLLLLGWLLTIIRRNPDLRPLSMVLIGLQMASLSMHFADLVSIHNFSRLYYAALDGILYLILAFNIGLSVRHGIVIRSLDIAGGWLSNHRRRHG